jgi:predicted alpha/beta hydrolase family esterase
MHTLIIPGWRNSGPGHWQTLWEAQRPDTTRVQQDNWVTPTRQAWVGAVSRAVLAQPDPVLLVAHSLGCIVVAHLPADVLARAHGALLVAPADPDRRAALCDFAPVPYQRLPFRSIVVGSTNDPFCPVRRSGAFARSWGSEFVRLSDAGHINVDSGFGQWPLGLSLLDSLAGQPAQALARAA